NNNRGRPDPYCETPPLLVRGKDDREAARTTAPDPVIRGPGPPPQARRPRAKLHLRATRPAAFQAERRRGPDQAGEPVPPMQAGIAEEGPRPASGAGRHCHRLGTPRLRPSVLASESVPSAESIRARHVRGPCPPAARFLGIGPC